MFQTTNQYIYIYMVPSSVSPWVGSPGSTAYKYAKIRSKRLHPQVWVRACLKKTLWMVFFRRCFFPSHRNSLLANLPTATPPPHHRGGRGKISYGTSIWDPSTTPQGGEGDSATPPPHHRGGGGRSHMGPVYGTHPIWGGEGGGQGLVHIYIYIYIYYITAYKYAKIRSKRLHPQVWVRACLKKTLWMVFFRRCFFPSNRNSLLANLPTAHHWANFKGVNVGTTS